MCHLSIGSSGIGLNGELFSFLFRNTFYRQLRGTAMGSDMAPTYANVFMAALNENVIYPSEDFKYVKAWWRYIDDIFAIWMGTQTELELFFQFLNKIDNDIKFTTTHLENSLQFLDTLIYKVNLYADLFVKPTDHNNLLKYNNDHP